MRRHRSNGPKCPVYAVQVKCLADFFGVFDTLLKGNAQFWFRGHSNFKYQLMPSALRYDSERSRTKAIELVADFRRLAEFKLPQPPAANDSLKWLQLAQHYGLGTRMLDWSENAAVALYFACQPGRSKTPTDGSVFIVNPIDLNTDLDPKNPRVFDAQVDFRFIEPYLKLNGALSGRGRKPTIAIHPVWNSERIVLQKGTFTLHGTNSNGLDASQATSLVKIPILGEYKAQILTELERIGVSEQTIFPELEHLCSHLVRKSNLT